MFVQFNFVQSNTSPQHCLTGLSAACGKTFSLKVHCITSNHCYSHTCDSVNVIEIIMNIISFSSFFLLLQSVVSEVVELIFTHFYCWGWYFHGPVRLERFWRETAKGIPFSPSGENPPSAHRTPVVTPATP